MKVYSVGVQVQCVRTHTIQVEAENTEKAMREAKAYAERTLMPEQGASVARVVFSKEIRRVKAS